MVETGQIAVAALCFLPFVVVIGCWVAWSDMARMKIPNLAVLALIGVFVVVGLGLVATGVWTLETWAWRWVHLVIILVIGFLGNMVGALGAGDAKFGAAMALFVVRDDASMFAAVLASAIVVGYTLHRVARMSRRIKEKTPEWESWTRGPDFPMGLCLAGGLMVYLAIGALWGH